MLKLAIALGLVTAIPLYSGVLEEAMQEVVAEGMCVDLRCPTYNDGVISTTQGGIIQAPGIRIQARSLTYTRKKSETGWSCCAEAEDQVFFEYGDYAFTAERLEYDFEGRSGIAYNVHSAIEPWYFGAETVDLLPDGTYTLHKGYITTSENRTPNWEICTTNASLYCDRYLDAENVTFRFFNVPLFWLPRLRADLESIFDTPIRYRIRWGGQQGPRVGMIYEILSWNDLKIFLRADYRLDRGPGGGFETDYNSIERCEEFYTQNYAARDSSIEEPNERFRYRFEGIYRRQWCNRTSLDITYDKYSDKEMPSDYYERGLDLETGKRTQLRLRRQEDWWVGSIYARARINNFETVKQELPSADVRLLPSSLEGLGIIADNQVSAGYLDFKYNDDLPPSTDFNSTRFEYSNRIYRPFPLGALMVTPETGLVSIVYGNSPTQSSQAMLMGVFGCNARTMLSKIYGNCRHSIIPYLGYRYYTAPSVSPVDHYIFDLNDGWSRLNTLQAGVRQLFYTRYAPGHVKRILTFDLYTYAFFDTPTIPKTIPKVYALGVWDCLPTLRLHGAAAWDFDENIVDHVNVRTEWTVTPQLAIAAEYRHRSPFAWRKIDYDNFVLDSFRPIPQLLNSSLSDRRDTFLVQSYYNFATNLALELSARRGWHRQYEANYIEYQTDLLIFLQGGWDLKLSFQHREGDHRFAIYMTLGSKRPPCIPMGPDPCSE